MSRKGKGKKRKPWRKFIRRQQRRLKRQFPLAWLLDPTDYGHEFRWLFWSPDRRQTWVEQRLLLKSNFWLFLLGVNNSGTTLLWRVIASHPAIRSLPQEGQRLSRVLPYSGRHDVARIFSARPDVFRWTEESHPHLALRVQYDWARYFETRPGILMDKSPHHTVRSRWLQRYFSPCRFLVIHRNPYAVCEGIRRRGDHSLEAAARHWVSTHEILFQDLPHLQHVLTLSYEDFCADPIQSLTRIERFLELSIPFDRQLLENPVKSHNLMGEPLKIQNLNEKSIQNLSPADRRMIADVAGPMMARLGYEPLLD